MQTSEARITCLCDAILDYVRRNPEAADTVRGVADWWLPAEQRGKPTQALEQALEQLVALRLIVRTQLPDGTILYGGKRKADAGGA